MRTPAPKRVTVMSRAGSQPWQSATRSQRQRSVAVPEGRSGRLQVETPTAVGPSPGPATAVEEPERLSSPPRTQDYPTVSCPLIRWVDGRRDPSACRCGRSSTRPPVGRSPTAATSISPRRPGHRLERAGCQRLWIAATLPKSLTMRQAKPWKVATSSRPHADRWPAQPLAQPSRQRDLLLQTSAT